MVVSDIQMAHLRAISRTDKCELCFYFKYSYKKYSMQTDLRAVRQMQENLSSLRKHIKNKINYYLNQDRKAAGDKNMIEVNIDIKFLDSSGNNELRSDVKLRDIISKRETFIFEIEGQVYKTFVNAPYIEKITLPDKLYVNSCITFNMLKCTFVNKEVSEYEWYTSNDKINWTLVSDEPLFNSTREHLGMFLKLKCTPKDKKVTGIPCEAISLDRIQDVPSFPETAFASRHAQTAVRLNNRDIRVVCYNTLADTYSEGQFPYVDDIILSIDYRKHLMAKEILGYNADVICLQEVDHRIYHSYLNKKLQAAGYGSIFHRKGNRLAEGLVIAYLNDRFKIKTSHQVVLTDLIKNDQRFSNIMKGIKETKQLRSYFMNQLTSLQFCRLVLRDTGEMIVVANTHLYYHKDAGNIRLIQAIVIMDYLRFILKESNDKNVKLIFCGDFNSQPTSSAFHYFTKGFVDAGNPESRVVSFAKKFKHKLDLESACGTPTFTNYVETFKGCLDYIFIQKSKFSVLKSLPCPEEEELSEYLALPNKNFPSDHIAQVVDLRLIS